MGKFLFSFLLPQKFNWKTNVVLAYNVLQPYAVGAFNHCINLKE